MVAAIALAVLPASALTSNPEANETPQIGTRIVGTNSVVGDVNNDGSINASDALMIMRYAMNLIALTETQLTAADCDGDGEANMIDALLLMRYCIGIPLPTPDPGQITDPTIIVDNAEASAGETVTVTVRIENNPGIAGAILRLSYDSALTLTGASNGEAFSYLQFTRPGQYSNPCNFCWDSESGMATEDGVILTLTFTVSNTAASGDTLDVSVSYTYGDIYDENLDDVDLDIINGHITLN